MDPAELQLKMLRFESEHGGVQAADSCYIPEFDVPMYTEPMPARVQHGPYVPLESPELQKFQSPQGLRLSETALSALYQLCRHDRSAIQAFRNGTISRDDLQVLAARNYRRYDEISQGLREA